MESWIDPVIHPLDGFRLFGGYYDITLSLKRMSDYYGYEIDEETLLGLGGGLGFLYRHRKGALPYVEGFAGIQGFLSRLSIYTGACVSEHTTTSKSKAYKAMLDLLNSGNPVMMFGDIAELPHWRREILSFQDGKTPHDEYHFGHHAFIVAGMDADQTHALLADFLSTIPWRKPERYELVSLQDLAAARDSHCMNTPPMNRWFTFSFSQARQPTPDDYNGAICKTILDMLQPTINNFGVPGMRKMALDLQNWPEMLTLEDLRRVLFSFYFQIEVAGASGSNIRELYARFLEHARKETDNPWLDQSARLFRFAAEQWRALVAPLSTVYSLSNPAVLLPGLAEDLLKISSTEETALKLLESAIPR